MSIIKQIKNCEGCAGRRKKVKRAFNIFVPKINVFSDRLTMWQKKLWNDLMDKPFMGVIDNVTGLKFRQLAYNDIGPKRHFFTVNAGRGILPPCDDCEGKETYIQKMTAASVWNVSNAASSQSGLTTQIDRGSGVYDTYDVGTSTTVDCDAFGYNFGAEGRWAGLGNVGSMDATTYVDGGGSTQTIRGVIHTDNQANCSDTDTFVFSLDGNITNSDVIWAEIDWDDINGTPQNIDRSVDITTYTTAFNGSSHWEWASVGTPDWTDIDANTDFVLTTS